MERCRSLEHPIKQCQKTTDTDIFLLSIGDVPKIISLAPALKFNGGGHINHTIFWTNLSPDGGGEPAGM